MKNHLVKVPTVLSLITILSIFSFQSCIKRGCTDPDATNYDKSAGGFEPGSCQYSSQYQLFGTYGANESYSTSYCGSSSDYYSVEVSQGSTSNSINITGLANGLGAIKFNINGYELTGIPANNKYTPWGTVDVLYAYGTISGSLIYMDFQVSDVNYNNSCGIYTSTATLSK